MKILVIGNGFDLAHGLPTTYSNFLDFVKACDEYLTYGTKRAPFDGFCEEQSGTPLFSEINSHIKTNNRLLKFFLSIYEQRCSEGKHGWIDFEKEISTIIQALDIARKCVVEQKFGGSVTLPPNVDSIVSSVLLTGDDGKGFGDHFPDDFEDGRVDCLLDGLNRLTRLLEIYLAEYVGSIEISKRLPECSGVDFTHVLSFNYTDTFQKLYDSQERLKYCYIHGDSKKDSNMEKCNMVLGIDEFLDQNRRDSDNCFIWFKKFYQRVYKGTDSEYIDWINLAEENAVRYSRGNPFINEVYIYGHSLDITDKDVLSKLITMRNTLRYVYYYSRDDLAKKIENLVKVIGEDELIRRTGGKKRTIHFVEAQK